jgi:hypothetical protein
MLSATVGSVLGRLFGSLRNGSAFARFEFEWCTKHQICFKCCRPYFFCTLSRLSFAQHFVSLGLMFCSHACAHGAKNANFNFNVNNNFDKQASKDEGGLSHRVGHVRRFGRSGGSGGL